MVSLGMQSPHDRIRDVVAAIPRGKASSYGAVAARAGLAHGARQVSWVLRRAGDSLPWHRVVNSGRGISLTGPDGERQRALLAHEGVEFTAGGKIVRGYMLEDELS